MQRVDDVSPDQQAGRERAAHATAARSAERLPERRLHLEVSDDELGARRAVWQPPATVNQPRGYARMYVEHVMQADRGADFDFLVGGG